MHQRQIRAARAVREPPLRPMRQGGQPDRCGRAGRLAGLKPCSYAVVVRLFLLPNSPLASVRVGGWREGRG